MRNRMTSLICGITVLIIVLLCTNVYITNKTVRNNTYLELENLGYKRDDITSIRIKHSYINGILGFNEWRISVEFNEIPDVLFWFSYRNNKIIFEGPGSDKMLDKESYIEYSDRFKHGTLLSDSGLLINIIDLTEINQLPTASAMEEFYKDDNFIYYFPSVKSEYIECEFNDGSKMLFTEALKEGKVFISDLNTYGIGYWLLDKDGNFINSLSK